MEQYPSCGVMLSKQRIGADDERAPSAMWGYFSLNQEANTAYKIEIK